MADYITYPINNVDYNAEDAQLYTATRRHGVYANDHFNATVTGVDNNVTIAPGIAWASPSEWGGVVFASKTPVLVSLPLADPSQPRYDLVTIKFNASTGFEGEISYTEGTPSSNPQIPPVSQNNNIFELGLFSIYRPVGATTITAGNVGDLRIDDTYCGLMRDGVTGIDTSVLVAQISDLIDTWKAESEVALSDLQKAIDDIIVGADTMLKLEYDPNKKGIDITNQEYAHTALNTLTGTGANGYFIAEFDGSVTEINGLSVKNGEETEIELISGVVYWFTIIGNTINFRSGSAGGGVPDGTTVLPVNDIEIWQKCASISTAQRKDTIAEILADTDLLQIIINSANAMEYLIRSTTIQTSVLGSANGINALDNSLPTITPDMLTNATPYGALTAVGAYTTNTYTAFNAVTSAAANVATTNGYVRYTFSDSNKAKWLYKFEVRPTYISGNPQIKIRGTAVNGDTVDLSDVITLNASDANVVKTIILKPTTLKMNSVDIFVVLASSSSPYINSGKAWGK